MTDFRQEEKIENSSTILNLSGSLNEHATLRSCTKNDTLVISLEGVTAFNSVGTRKWCEWVKSLAWAKRITLKSCPVVMINSFNQVQGALAANMVVESFFVPYYSDETGERKDVLFRKGIHFTPSGDIKESPVSDGKGNLMEIDVVPQMYFKFLGLK